jgi:hypothetical protein
VVALLEDRIATFLARTQNELGTELEALKLIYEQNVVTKEKTPQIGIEAESRIYKSLCDQIQHKGYADDQIQLTGSTVGTRLRNKTSDILIKVDGNDSKRIAIEIKFDASITVGAFGQGDSTSKTRDTAISQLIEARVNRDASISIFVFDSSRCADSVAKQVSGIKWIPDIGFLVIVDYDRDDFTHLHVTVDLARSMLNSEIKMGDASILEALLQRLVADIGSIKETEKLLLANHDNLKKIAKSIQKHALLVEFTQGAILRFIQHGQISQEELLDLYRGEGIRDQYRAIENDIEKLFPVLASR